MARPLYALIFLAAAACSPFAAAQTSVTPQSGVLVLRNGQVLTGDVTRAGDFYVVNLGEGSELRMNANEVELFCASLTEAYEFKSRHVVSFSAKSRLELARWCLRNGLELQCQEQLAAAKNIDPTNTQVAELESRLKFLQESPPPPTESTLSTAAVADVEAALRGLPRGSVEKFGAIVQPILLNRCGANQCHGPNAKSEFRLLRPPPGQIVSRRFTQRNLHATLKYLDRTSPDNSPLVLLPQQRHGNSLAAVFDKKSSNQLAELAAWARLTAGGSSAARPATSPATISPVNATLSQPTTGSANSSPLPVTFAEPKTDSATGVRVMRPPLDEQAAPKSKSSTQQPEFRDRYDPEIFNRRFHAK